MCGIIGQINFKKTKPKLDCFYAANEKQAFRGPDDEGIILDGVLLGHKRLSILDLSQHAHQPMSDAKLGLIIVFNGEIYNFKDVKKKLVKKGYSFHSTGDTEVVLKAYHAWKEKCLEKFFGMFSIAVWDKQKQELFLAKDHLGIKPLYYYQDKNRFRFASHLPSLLEFNDFNPLLDRTALNYYFSFHAIVPAPHTIIKQIKKLEPGTWAKINKHGKIKKQKYWEMNFETQKINNYEKCKKLVLSSLDESVQRHMESDVPVGVLLSGGLDSSLIVALLSKHSQKNLKTFSIGFEDEKEKGNEFEYSDLIASEFSTKHKKIFIKNENAIKNLEQCVSHMSEPMVSHDAIGFYLLSNEVSKHVKVVQSGQGADEVFAGYHWHEPMLNSSNSAKDYYDLFSDMSFNEYSQLIQTKHVSKNHARKFICDSFSKKGAKTSIEKTLRLDCQTMLVEDPVKRVDNMTMAFSLEARVPFLDKKVVQTSTKIPAKFKVFGGGKKILKDASRTILPKKIIDREKGYFPMPGLKYIQGPYLKFVEKVLSNKHIKKRKIFKQNKITQMFQKPEKQITSLGGSKLWQAAVLELWLQKNLGVM